MASYSSTLVLLTVLSLHYSRCCEGYGGGPPESTCNGKTQCTFNNRTGVEFAVDPAANSSDIVCKFGQTSLDSLPNAYCTVVCEATTVYECACVSESVARGVLVDEGVIDTVVGSLLLALLIPAYCSYKRVLAKAKRDRELLKLEGYHDNTSTNCIFLFLAMGLLGIGAAFLANGVALTSRNFWLGCGDA